MKTDHRLLLANLLLPACSCVPRQRKGQDKGYGDGCLQARGLPGRARQDEQPWCAQDRHQALNRVAYGSTDEAVKKGEIGNRGSGDEVDFEFIWGKWAAVAAVD